MLFDQGDPVRDLFRVEEGLVLLIRVQPDGAETVLQRAAQGAVLAEASLYAESYHCRAEAAEPARLSCFDAAQLRHALGDDGALSRAYAAHLAAEVQKLRLRAEVLAKRRLSDRLDAWLDWHGGVLPGRGGWRTLAREIGVTPEALYRELARRRA